MGEVKEENQKEVPVSISFDALAKDGVNDTKEQKEENIDDLKEHQLTKESTKYWVTSSFGHKLHNSNNNAKQNKKEGSNMQSGESEVWQSDEIQMGKQTPI